MDEHLHLSAADNQAKLMRWYYPLNHLLYSTHKQLVLNGEIPRCLAKIKPLACVGCLFVTMTKVPWRGRETSSNHQVGPGGFTHLRKRDNQYVSTLDATAPSSPQKT